jgi:trk system potassium uptake protein TrkA
MKIVILGAGQVGANLAASLVSEANDITVVDIDAAKLSELQDRYDLRTVCGHAAHPSILTQAGLGQADMLVAVTQNDETNMIACKLGQILFNVPTKIARIRSRDYLGYPDMFSPDNLSVDFTISPENEVTTYIKRLVDYPEALQVVDFAGGRIRLVAVKALKGGPLVGHQLQELRRHLPTLDARVAAIFRRGTSINPSGSTIIEAGDEVFFLAATENIRAVMKEMRSADQSARRVMIVGGGNIGSRLAEALEGDYEVKLIDHDKRRAEKLAESLHSTLVLAGDATDENLLVQENVEDMDVFCALTNDDEDNIMAALLAKRMGVKKVIALINRGAYVDLLQGGQIDVALSPAQATLGPLLTHIRRGDMAAVHSLRRGAAEALEVVVHGDSHSSRLVSRRLDEIDLPEGVSLGALLRGDKVVIVHHDTVIESEDHLIFFVPNKRMLPKVERLLQVGFGFF